MNNNKPTVAVLMSTYNGEKYIKEQLDSIFSQTGTNVKLYVRDDGSTDSTIEILKKYKQNYPITILWDNENVGPGESFLRLVYKFAHEREIDYFAFADQDDIWLPDKLDAAIKNIESCDCDEPVLYSSNQYLYIDGVNKGLRHKEQQSVALIPHMTKNTIAGCTFVFNKKLAQLIADAERPDYRVVKYRLHDAWIMLVAIVCGHVIYDGDAYILYRIHDGNTVGLKTLSLKQRWGKLQRFWNQRDDANLRMLTAQQLLESFPGIRLPDKRVLLLYANYQNSWRDKWALLSQRNILRECEENAFIFCAKVLMNFV